MRPTRLTLSATGSTAWIPVDYTMSTFNLGIQVIVSAGASLVWAVEMTAADIYDTTVTPTATTAPSPLDTGTGTEVGNITIPCTAIRLTGTITSGTATIVLIQGRK